MNLKSIGKEQKYILKQMANQNRSIMLTVFNTQDKKRRDIHVYGRDRDILLNEISEKTLSTLTNRDIFTSEIVGTELGVTGVILDLKSEVIDKIKKL
jgi:hypothetical protein